jgi:hypothetical protein
VCSHVALFGFFAAERQGARYHYYDLTPAPPVPLSTAEWAQTRALAAAGLVAVTDECLAQCHVSLSACGTCLHMSIPDLFKVSLPN